MKIAEVSLGKEKNWEDSIECMAVEFNNTGIRGEFMSKAKVSDNWIPVEEKLPSNMRNVLVTAIDADGQRYTSTDRYDVVKGVWFRFNGSDKVIAWQPFPEAYKGD